MNRRYKEQDDYSPNDEDRQMGDNTRKSYCPKDKKQETWDRESRYNDDHDYDEQR